MHEQGMTRWQESTCLRAFSAQRVPGRREEWRGGRGGDQTGPRARERVTARVTECRGRRPVHSLTLARYLSPITSTCLHARNSSFTDHQQTWLFLLHYGWSVYLTLVKLSNLYSNKSREHDFLLPLLLPYNYQILRLWYLKACLRSKKFQNVLFPNMFIDKGTAALNL